MWGKIHHAKLFQQQGLDDHSKMKRGNVFIHYLQIATDLKAKYIVIENVRGLLSAVHKPSEYDETALKNAKGTALEYIVNFLGI